MPRAENFTNYATTVLALGGNTLSSSALTFTVLQGATFPAADFYVSIDTEIMYITSRSGNTFTVASTADRGLDGTTAAVHADGAVVYAGVLAHNLADEYAHINGTTNVHGILNTNGLLSLNTGVHSANYMAQNHDVVFVSAVSGNLTITLPLPTADALVYVKKIDTTTNTVTVDAPTGSHVDGAVNMVLSIPYESYQYISDGSNWYVF